MTAGVTRTRRWVQTKGPTTSRLKVLLQWVCGEGSGAGRRCDGALAGGKRQVEETEDT